MKNHTPQDFYAMPLQQSGPIPDGELTLTIVAEWKSLFLEEKLVKSVMV